MTDKELRRLRRRELLELLIAQSDENEKLKRELSRTQAELNNKRIAIEYAGSLAEAALRLNGVFEAADRAAKQYLENARRMAAGKGQA